MDKTIDCGRLNDLPYVCKGVQSNYKNGVLYCGQQISLLRIC